MAKLEFIHLPISDEGEGKPPPSMPLAEAQIDELRDRFRRYHDNNSAGIPGDIVKEKSGLGWISDIKPGAVMILWRYLDLDDPIDAAIIERFIDHTHITDVDCIVGLYDGAQIMFLPHDCRQLERVHLPESAEEQKVGEHANASL